MENALIEDALPLDEPTKLRQLVVPLLAEFEQQSVKLGNHSTAELVLGAAAQDDCAAYHVKGEQMLVFGSDYVRGTKFHLYEEGYLNNYDVGWYLAGANLSDVAAMGAVPLGLLSVIRYPRRMADSEFTQLLRGVSDGCRAVGALNVGGDIGTAERVILSGAAFGSVEPTGLLRRDAAKPGQLLILTGQTGEAGAAMKLSTAKLLERLNIESREVLLRRWKRVAPRVAHGRVFSNHSGVTACTDTSDGLKGALESLSRSSSVRFSVNAASLPISTATRQAAELLDVSVWDLALGDSVDFELLATVDTDEYESLRQDCADARLPLFVIGSVQTGEGISWEAGTASSEFLPGKEWRHD